MLTVCCMSMRANHRRLTTWLVLEASLQWILWLWTRALSLG